LPIEPGPTAERPRCQLPVRPTTNGQRLQRVKRRAEQTALDNVMAVVFRFAQLDRGRRWLAGCTGAALPLAMALAGCGASATRVAPAAAVPATPDASSLAAVRECLAKRGIVLQPKGGRSADHEAELLREKPAGISRKQFEAALRGCGVTLPSPPQPAPDGSPYLRRMKAVLERFARCMDDRGVEVGPPNTSGKGPIFTPQAGTVGSRRFRAALAFCRPLLVGMLPFPRVEP